MEFHDFLLLFDEHREDDRALRVSCILDMPGIRVFERGIDERVPVGLLVWFEESVEEVLVFGEHCDLLVVEL